MQYFHTRKIRLMDAKTIFLLNFSNNIVYYNMQELYVGLSKGEEERIFIQTY